ncbi:hypothetical protein [Streptomyces sp. x-80]|uniref:hypothetical protein n=1 Tax=Streptomyces sp. x-80 TaxID=2789282 RepID=UPI00397FD8E0
MGHSPVAPGGGRDCHRLTPVQMFTLALYLGSVAGPLPERPHRLPTGPDRARQGAEPPPSTPPSPVPLSNLQDHLRQNGTAPVDVSGVSSFSTAASAISGLGAQARQALHQWRHAYEQSPGNYVSDAMEWLRAGVDHIEDPKGGVAAAPIPYQQSARSPVFQQTVEMPGRCTVEGEFAENTLTAACAADSDFTVFYVYARWRDRYNTNCQWDGGPYPADGRPHAFPRPRFGFDPVGEVRVTLVPRGQRSPMDSMPLVQVHDEPENLDLGASGDLSSSLGKNLLPAFQEASPEAQFGHQLDSMMPHRDRPRTDPPELDVPKAPVDPVAQAGLARGLDGLASLAKNGARAFDFKKAGAALGRGGSLGGTVINLSALSNSVTADEINPIVVGTTSVSTVSTALGSIESLAKLGKTPFFKKLAKFAGKLAGRAGLLADVGTLGNTIANQGKGSHPLNIAVDGSAVVGSAVALAPGLGPAGFLIAVPALMYTFADVFLANPPLPDAFAAHLKTCMRDAVLDSDRQVKEHYQAKRELVQAEREFNLAGLREQRRNDPGAHADRAEYHLAKQGFHRNAADKLAAIDRLEAAALTDARGKIITMMRGEADKWVQDHKGFFGTLAPTRSLDLVDFMRANGNWNISMGVETDAYWKDYMLGMISTVTREARENMDRISGWAQTSFSDWPRQPAKHYASWIPFFGYQTYAESKGYPRPPVG